MELMDVQKANEKNKSTEMNWKLSSKTWQATSLLSFYYFIIRTRFLSLTQDISLNSFPTGEIFLIRVTLPTRLFIEKTKEFHLY